MSRITYDSLMKLLLIGSSSVGKTCMLVKYVEDSFESSFISTIGIDFKIKTITIDDRKVKLQIWDTAGQERFKTITVSYYRGAMGILLIYDTTNRKSFEDVTEWLETINKNANDTSVVLLVGSKSDLKDRRSVEYSEGSKLAKERNVLFIETSSKTGENVNEAFEMLTREILKRNPVTTNQPNMNENRQTNLNQQKSNSNSCC